MWKNYWKKWNLTENVLLWVFYALIFLKSFYLCCKNTVFRCFLTAENTVKAESRGTNTRTPLSRCPGNRTQTAFGPLFLKETSGPGRWPTSFEAPLELEFQRRNLWGRGQFPASPPVFQKRLPPHSPRWHSRPAGTADCWASAPAPHKPPSHRQRPRGVARARTSVPSFLFNYLTTKNVQFFNKKMYSLRSKRFQKSVKIRTFNNTKSLHLIS